jgi:serine/threonine protein kinase
MRSKFLSATESSNGIHGMMGSNYVTMTNSSVLFLPQTTSPPLTQATAPTFTGSTLFPSSIGLAVPGYCEVPSDSFALLRQIAEGGGGQIHIAQAMTPETSIYGQNLIVKIFGNNQDKISPRQRMTVKQEISILQLMSNNRHFPKFIGYCEKPLCILMKYYECGSLKDYLQKQLQRIHKLRISSDIAKGLLALHRNHVAHCDLKPPNVLLERAANGRLVAIITDFGIARITSDVILSAKAFNVVNLRGLSWHYAAPEVIRRFRGSTSYNSSLALNAGDTYAFAIIIYELLSRMKPW